VSKVRRARGAGKGRPPHAAARAGRECDRERATRPNQSYQDLQSQRRLAAYLIRACAGLIVTAQLVFCAELFLVSIAPRIDADRRGGQHGGQRGGQRGSFCRQAEGLRMNRTSMRVRMSRPRAFATMAGLAALVLAGGLWSQASARPVGARINLSSLYWMFYKEDFNHINAKEPALIRQIVAGPAIYVLEQRLGGSRLPGKVIPVEIFFSSAGLQAAIDHHRVIPGVKFVTDDLENLRITPAAERTNPIPAMKDFAHTAHANGYQPILVPGRDLMRVPRAVCSQQSSSTSTISQLDEFAAQRALMVYTSRNWPA
jgi:hypothetical protein